MSTEKKPLEKVCIICAKGSLEDVYATLVMANGAVMPDKMSKLLPANVMSSGTFLFRNNRYKMSSTGIRMI